MDSSSALLPPSGKDQYYNNYPPRACLCIICFGIKIRTRTLPDCSINEYVLVWGRIFNYSGAFSSSSHPHTRTKKKRQWSHGAAGTGGGCVQSCALSFITTLYLKPKLKYADGEGCLRTASNRLQHRVSLFSDFPWPPRVDLQSHYFIM